VLPIEAQEMNPTVLCELRLLASADLDSRSILTVILAGDARLAAKLDSPELSPLASRIRCRLRTEAPRRILGTGRSVLQQLFRGGRDGLRFGRGERHHGPVHQVRLLRPLPGIP
jgi:type II secretory pathway predicted ATPase ExeA